MSNSMADKLRTYRILINNSEDPAIATLLLPYGIDADEISRGKQLYSETEALFKKQKKEYQEQELAFDEYTLAKDNVQNMFNKTLKLTKLSSRKDPDLQNRLKLTTGIAKAIERWIESALALYDRLENEPAFVATLANRGITPETLAAENEAVKNLKVLRDKATAEKGEAQEATRLRNQKLEELQDYCFELREIATIAVGNNSQLLEKLGIIVK